MALKLITAATASPVTLAEAKLSHRFDASDLDDDIEDMLLDAARLVEHETGKCMMPQTWELTLDAFPDVISLTRVPVASVTYVKYIDSDGTLQTLSSATYTVSTADNYGHANITPVYDAIWPITRDQINAVTVRYVAGYASASAVPSHLKRLVKICVAKMIDDPMQINDQLASIEKVYGA